MKKIIFLIILTSFNFLLSAQDNVDEIKKFIITYNGDSTLFSNTYEIDINKRKVYYITPIMNYLHVKGKKYRTRIKIKKHKWEEVNKLIVNLNSTKYNYQDKNQNGEIIYSFAISTNNSETERFVFKSENIPSDLRRLFEIIRE
ncbi:MAG: hypothetical protein GY756_23310 [bacterium]|nr:hypothetical protein [bacterium]